MGGRGVRFPRKKHYEDVRFNVISVTWSWLGVKFPEKSVTQHFQGPEAEGLGTVVACAVPLTAITSDDLHDLSYQIINAPCMGRFSTV